MTPLLIHLALFFGQLPTLQDRPIIRFYPSQDSIRADQGGSTIVLSNSPRVVHLPSVPPLMDARRKPWVIDIRNSGPGAVSIVGKAQFKVEVEANHTVEVKSDGKIYSVIRPQN